MLARMSRENRAAPPPRSSPRLGAWAATTALAAAGWLVACGDGAGGGGYLDWDGRAAFDLPKPRLPALHRASGTLLGLTSDSQADTVTVIDLAAHQVLATLPIGRHPVEVDGPFHLGFDRASRLLFVGLSYPPGAGASHGHGESTRPGWVQQWRLSPFELVAEREVANNPTDLRLSEDGHRLVVGHFDLVNAAKGASLAAKRASLSVFPLAGGVLGPAVEVPACVAPHGIALRRPDGATAWVACFGEDALAVIGLAGTPTMTLVPMPEGQGPPGAPIVGPSALRLSPAGDRLAVTTNVTLDVRFFDVAQQAFVGPKVPLLATPLWPAWSAQGDRLWVPTQHADAVKVVAAGTGAILAERTFLSTECRRPHEAVVADDGKTVWLLCEGNGKTAGKVLTLDPQTLATRAEVAVGVAPVHLLVVTP